MFRDVSIIGDGGMGTACAIILCSKAGQVAGGDREGKGLRVRMWGYDAQQLSRIEQAGENIVFLPGHKLPEGLLFEGRDEEILLGADLIVSAVPCQYMRGVWQRLSKYVGRDAVIVSVTKGIENETLLRPSEILRDVLGSGIRCSCLSGPTIADELAEHLPATACAACADTQVAVEVQQTFSLPWFRVYTNTDILGVELAGAMKNVIAIAAGIVDGVRAGDNAKAALLCRGLAEITRLGVAMGAQWETFAGLGGMGDLVTTCISPKGRNRGFGERIGAGASTAEALGATKSVVEGVATCRSVVELASRYGVEMPIAQAVYAVVFEGKSVQAAIGELMSRALKSE